MFEIQAERSSSGIDLYVVGADTNIAGEEAEAFRRTISMKHIRT